MRGSQRPGRRRRACSHGSDPAWPGCTSRPVESGRSGTTAADVQRIIDLEKENRKLLRADQILYSAFFAADLTCPLGKRHLQCSQSGLTSVVITCEIVGWQVSRSSRTEVARDAQQMGICQRRRADGDLPGLVHRSNPRVRYRAFRCREDLAEQDTVRSVGSRGDSSDNDLAKALNSRGKAELIRNRGP